MNKFEVKDAPIIYYLSLLVGTVFSFLAQFIFEAKSDAYILLLFIVPQLGNALAYYGYSKYRKLDLKETVTFSKPQIKGIALCVIITVLLFVQNLFFVSLANDFLKFINFQGNLPLPDVTNPVMFIWSVMAICVLPAVFEELIFRGVFAGGLKNINETFAIIISALIFSLMHFNLTQIIHQFIMGAVLAFIYLKTKNLIYPILIHFLNNFIALTITALGKNIVISGYWYILSFALSIICFILLLFSLKALCGRKQFVLDKKPALIENLKKNSSVWILLAFLLFISIINAITMF